MLYKYIPFRQFFLAQVWVTAERSAAVNIKSRHCQLAANSTGVYSYHLKFNRLIGPYRYSITTGAWYVGKQSIGYEL